MSFSSFMKETIRIAGVGLYTQKPLGIAAKDSVSNLRVQALALYLCKQSLVADEGVVGAEEDLVEADQVDCVGKIRQGHTGKEMQRSRSRRF